MSKSLNKKTPGNRLVSYSIAAGATALAAGGASGAVTSISPGATGSWTYDELEATPVNLDLNGDGTNDFRLSSSGSTSNGGGIVFRDASGGADNLIASNGGGYVANIAGGTQIGVDYVANLAAGLPANRAASFSFVAERGIAAPPVIPDVDYTHFIGGSSVGEFSNNRGFVAVQFDIPGGSPHFGYLDAEVVRDTLPGGNQLIIHGGAYQSSRNAILAGAAPVPEPSALGLLALGGGVGLLRRRRKTKAA